MTLRAKRVLTSGALTAVAALVVVAVVASASEPPDGPVDLAWDRAPCAECGMLVGEPAFAAQLHERDGTVRAFDDAGCLFRWREDHAESAHAVYFHHMHEARWLGERDAAFVRVPRTPMGYGFGAVDRGTTGAIEPEAAARLLHAERRR